MSVKYIALLLLVVVSFTVARPAFADFCRQSNGHTFCILSIKRSAKYYWQYRAVVSIDGVKQPSAIYNCRARVRVQKDGAEDPPYPPLRRGEGHVRFAANDPGELLCGLFQK